MRNKKPPTKHKRTKSSYKPHLSKRPPPSPIKQFRDALGEALQGKNILKFLLLMAIWGFVVVGAVVGYFSYELPSILRHTDLKRHPSVVLEAHDGTVFDRYGDYHGDMLAIKDLPQHLVQAFLAIEDRRFYDHSGIDMWGILRAGISNVAAGHLVQGGSTITQQLAKNIFLGSQRTLRRKVQEILLSIWLENKLSKDDILAAYLNRIYLGSGAYGVDAAAHIYFNKSARDVTLSEAAILASLPKAPSHYSPLNNPAAAEARSRIVIQAMVDAKYLLPNQKLETVTQAPLPSTKPGGGGDGKYFVDWTMDQLGDLIEEQNEDVVIRTTLDLPMQREAERQIDTLITEKGDTARVSQAAMVSIGQNGAVRALVGGRDYADSSFNRATQARRQPGSAFKPVVYLAALEKGIDKDEKLLDAPLKIGKWSPENYTENYRGEVSMKDALANSLNTATIRLAEKTGISRIEKLATRLGISTPMHHELSLALGTNEVSLMDLTSVYAVFAHHGRAVIPYAIERITTKSGKVLYERAAPPMPQLVDGDNVAALDEMLQACVSYGTGKKAALNQTVSGKTGTTQDYRDAWFIGYTGRMTTGIWMGNDDNKEMNKITGGNLPAQLWHDYMMAAVTHEDKDSEPAYTHEQSGGFKKFLDGLLGGSLKMEQAYPRDKR